MGGKTPSDAAGGVGCPGAMKIFASGGPGWGRGGGAERNAPPQAWQKRAVGRTGLPQCGQVSGIKLTKALVVKFSALERRPPVRQTRHSHRENSPSA